MTFIKQKAKEFDDKFTKQGIPTGIIKYETEHGIDITPFKIKQFLKQALKEQMEIAPEKLARMFHDVYELVAPLHGYETREDTKVFDPESKNGKTMIATCKIVISQLKDN